ncbi:Nuclear pore glycoprotein p62 [Operophtera brumata]|uniref:Nuclear pore glycoprotein p62 n=1 Tax=Operophtera brumata TaxID=104452 RepID=A0A0L7LHZ3_OPEBR|nr:Nuclear pore glycoprotein p62 [Operophtera brumata]
MNQSFTFGGPATTTASTFGSTTPSTGVSFAPATSAQGAQPLALTFGSTPAASAGQPAGVSFAPAASAGQPAGVSFAPAASAGQPAALTFGATPASSASQPAAITFGKYETNENEQRGDPSKNQSQEFVANYIVTIVELNDVVQLVKNEQQSLEHELDFVLAQQQDLAVRSKEV